MRAVLVPVSEWLMNSSTVATFLPASPAGSPDLGGLFTRRHPQRRTETCPEQWNTGQGGSLIKDSAWSLNPYPHPSPAPLTLDNLLSPPGLQLRPSGGDRDAYFPNLP